MKFKFSKVQKIILVGSDNSELIVNIDSTKKVKSPINEYHFLGHVGEENCSGTDVGIDFRSLPNRCSEKNGRVCCRL